MTRLGAAPLRLTRRSDFLRAATGSKGHAGFVSVQAKPVDDAGRDEAVRVGFTASRKVGNAVARNRAKRRLREAVRMPGLGLKPRHDYVVVARTDVVSAPWPRLVDSLRAAIRKAHAPRRDRAGEPGGGPRGKPTVDHPQQ